MRLGSLVRVWYTDDDVWHERLVLLRGGGKDEYWVVTPDQDLYEENLGGDAEDGPQRVRVVPYGTRTRYTRPVYKFKEEVTAEFLEEKILQAWREHESAYGGPPLDDEVVVFPDGSNRSLFAIGPRRRLRRKSHAEQLPRGAAAQGDAAPAGHGHEKLESDFDSWVVVYSTRESLLGTQVSPSQDVPLVRTGAHARKLYTSGGDVVLARGLD